MKERIVGLLLLVLVLVGCRTRVGPADIRAWIYHEQRWDTCHAVVVVILPTQLLEGRHGRISTDSTGTKYPGAGAGYEGKDSHGFWNPGGPQSDEVSAFIRWRHLC